MGATGYLLALFCSDMCSAVFVFLAGGCAQYFRPRQIRQNPLGRDAALLRADDPGFDQLLGHQRLGPVLRPGHVRGYGGRSSEAWVGLLSTGYFLPQIITFVGQFFYEAWQLSAVTEEEDRAAFFSKIFRVYASVLFCCAAGIIWLCHPLMYLFRADYYDAWQFVPFWCWPRCAPA